ncbi:MAG: hypothetical protein KDC24_12705, partial [Saprospiraceae bacterium]|nr:hypothetical protein [Saprospiraceae bacterium]
DYEKIQAMVDQRINFKFEGTDKRFFALSDNFLLVASNIKKGYTLAPDYTKKGNLVENGAQVFIPVAECIKNGDGEWVAKEVISFIPYILVDCVITLITGREQLGFPKAFGRFVMPDGVDNVEKISCEGFGFQTFEPDGSSFGGFFPWLDITRTEKDDNGLESGWKSMEEAWDAIKQIFKHKPQDDTFHIDLPFIWKELEDLKEGVSPMLFLKQFRDATFPTLACYQEIIKGNGKLLDFKGGGLMGGTYEVVFHDFASFPIKEDLGLPDKIVVEEPWWVQADMEFAVGVTVKPMGD